MMPTDPEVARLRQERDAAIRRARTAEVKCVTLQHDLDIANRKIVRLEKDMRTVVDTVINSIGHMEDAITTLKAMRGDAEAATERIEHNER